MTQALPILVRRLRKSYGSSRILNAVDLDIRGGEFMTLLGPSGSGKTTLLMIVAGFAGADGGSVLLGGTELLGVPPHKRGLGVVFQNYALFPHMTVAENIAYPLKARHRPAADIRDKVRQALALVRLDGFGDRRIDQLSGGQKQRIALARAIVFEPAVLLMDEPLSALDKNLREEMQFEIRALHERLGLTSIYVTHDQKEALTMSDRICVMDKGAIVQVGTPLEIYRQPSSLFVASFIGHSNLIDVEVGGGQVVLDGIPLFSLQSDEAAPGHHKLMIRPENVAIVGEEALPSSHVGLPAEVRRAVYQGDRIFIETRLAGGAPLNVLHPARGMDRCGLPVAGDQVILAFDRADTCLLCS